MNLISNEDNFSISKSSNLFFHSPYIKSAPIYPSNTEDYSGKVYHLKTTTTRLIKCARWVLLSNTIGAYWPFSIQSTISSHQEDDEEEKYLNFSYPTCGLFLSCLYVIFNVGYVIYYFLFPFFEYRKVMGFYDLTLMITWNLLAIVGVTAHRFYGIRKLSQFELFWDKILHVVHSSIQLTCEDNVQLALGQVTRWSVKWLVISTALGIMACSGFMYGSSTTQPLLDALLTVGIGVQFFIHNSSAFLLIFLIKIMTQGFSLCKIKLEQMHTAQLQPFENKDKRDLFKLSKNASLLVLDKVFELIEDLEDTVNSFNSLFAFSLFLEAVFSFSQIIFAVYFLHENPIFGNETVATLNFLTPIVAYSACFICLCVAASKLTSECQAMMQSFQRLPSNSVSCDDNHKVQLLVSRITYAPPGIRIAQLIQIRESLLVSVLNALATYFVVLVQMKQVGKSTSPEKAAMK